ncbi:MAG: MaoC-like dehydratase [Ramlibacter sp.]|nr:MaoC-like dehydratase [Ramlibacter sp.]
MNAARLLAKAFPVEEHHYTERDAILYALGLGIGLDPTDPRQLRYVYEQTEGGLQVLPTLAVTLAYPGHWARDPEFGLDWQNIVHVEQGLRLHNPIPPGGTVVAQTRITQVIDKGAGKGALIYSHRSISDKATGRSLADVSVVTLARGDGGQGGTTALPAPPHPLPGRAPDATMDFQTSPQASLIYRLSADLNPLHADPAVAARAGYARPLAHGLWTFGVAGHCVIEMACAGDPRRLASLACRFSGPAYAGDTIRVESWVDGIVASFRATVPARGAAVLSHGRADIHLD